MRPRPSRNGRACRRRPAARVDPVLVPVLGQAGVAGVMLWWLMTRVEDRLREQSKASDLLRAAVNRQTLAQLLDVLSRTSASPEVRRQATALVDEIKAEQAAQQQGAG
jgi:hypothetical protein